MLRTIERGSQAPCSVKLFGRRGWIRTSDLLFPKQTRYQAALHTDFCELVVVRDGIEPPTRCSSGNRSTAELPDHFLKLGSPGRRAIPPSTPREKSVSCHHETTGNLLTSNLAPGVGVEPTTSRLTAERYCQLSYPETPNSYPELVSFPHREHRPINENPQLFAGGLGLSNLEVFRTSPPTRTRAYRPAADCR